MVFVDFLAFDKHLKANYQTSKVYLIFLPDSYERREVLDHIHSVYLNYEKIAFEAVEENIPKIQSEILSPSLFCSEKLIYLDDLSQLKKNSLTIKSMPPNIVLVGGCSSKKHPLSKNLTDQAVILDLSKEKPWDKEKRLGSYLQTLVAKEKKRISPALVTMLFEKVGTDLALLKQQIDKLLSFAADRQEITEQDITLVVEDEKSQTAWKLGEEIVWQNKWKFSVDQVDTSLFFPLVAALRHQLQLGYQICSLLEEGVKDLASHFPKVYPNTLKKRIAEAKAFGKEYFKEGIKELYQMEINSKTYSHSFSAYLDQFVCKLTYL